VEDGGGGGALVLRLESGLSGIVDCCS